MECKNWTVHFKNFDNFHPFNRRKVRHVQLSSNFFLLLSLISHSRARFEYVFLKKDTSKVEILSRFPLIDFFGSKRPFLWRRFSLKY